MIYNPDVHKTKKLSRAERLKNTLTVATAAGGVAVTGAFLLHHAHEADAELLQSQPKETTISVEVSSQTEIIPVKVNDTVGTIVEANTKVTTTDAAKIPKYVAFDAAVDKVEELNKDGALADGILQADKETLIVPDEITVSPDTTDSK